jgi:hypothetical protein
MVPSALIAPKSLQVLLGITGAADIDHSVRFYGIIILPLEKRCGNGNFLQQYAGRSGIAESQLNCAILSSRSGKMSRDITWECK